MRNKLYTRLKPLARAFCAGYNREGSKKAADILLRYVQGDPNRTCNLSFILKALYLGKSFALRLGSRYLVSEIQASLEKDGQL